MQMGINIHDVLLGLLITGANAALQVALSKTGLPQDRIDAIKAAVDARITSWFNSTKAKGLQLVEAKAAVEEIVSAALKENGVDAAA